MTVLGSIIVIIIVIMMILFDAVILHFGIMFQEEEKIYFKC